MAQLLRDGLIITVVGMGLVFGALALLWGVMVLLQRLLPEGRRPWAMLVQRRPEEPAAEEAPPTAEALTAPSAAPTPAQLAAIVVALARWQQEEVATRSIGWRLPPLLTRWMAVGRGRQVQSWTGRR